MPSRLAPNVRDTLQKHQTLSPQLKHSNTSGPWSITQMTKVPHTDATNLSKAPSILCTHTDIYIYIYIYINCTNYATLVAIITIIG